MNWFIRFPCHIFHPSYLEQFIGQNPRIFRKDKSCRESTNQYAQNKFHPSIQSIHNLVSSERTEIDKAAATRFIKHAIAQAQWKETAAEEDDEDNNDNDNTQQIISSSSYTPVKITSKMIQRAAYEKEIKEQDTMGTDEDEELEIFEGDAELPTPMEGGETRKGKGKETPPATANGGTRFSRNKRRKPVVDPFAGIFNPPST